MKIVLSSLAVLAFAGLLLFLGGDKCADDSYADPVGGDCSAAGDGSVTWSFENGTITISGNGAMADYTAALPNGGQPWSDYRATIRHISIGAGVTHIGDYAFCALSGRSANGGLDIAEGSALQSVGAHAFDESSRSYWSVGCFITSDAVNPIPQGLVTIGESAYENTNIEEVIIPSSVKTVGANAFKCNENVQDIGIFTLTIRADLDEVGSYAFTKIVTLKLEAGAPVSAGENAFMPRDSGYKYEKYFEIVTDSPMAPEDIAKFSLRCINYVLTMPAGEVTIVGPKMEGDNKIDIPWDVTNRVPWNGQEVSKISYVNVGKINGKALADAALNYTGSQGNYTRIIDSLVIDGQDMLISESGFRLVQKGESKLIYKFPDGKTVFAADDFPASVTDFTFNYRNTTVESMTIPSRATAFGIDRYAGFTSLTSLKIEAPITAISVVSWPSGLKSIDLSMTKLTGVGLAIGTLETAVLPDTITSLNGTFNGCRNLKSVNLDNITELKSNAFNNCSSLTDFTMPKLSRIDGYNVFANTHITTMDLSNVEITENSYGLFSGCADLTSVTFPSGYKALGNTMFAGCTSLASFDLTGFESVNQSAFSGCTSLKSMVIPATVTTVGNYAFQNCSGLESVSIASATLGTTVFYNCTSLESVTIESTCTSIGVMAFAGCTSLRTITIPATVTTLGQSMFSGCTSLESVSLPAVTSIYERMFENCSSLKSFTVPDGVTSIGNYAFSGCKSLESVSFPASVTSIGNYAFQNTGLKSFTLPKSITLTTNVLYGSPIETISLPADYEGENTVVDGMLMSGNALVIAPGVRTLVLPDEVKNIISNDAISSLTENMVLDPTGWELNSYRYFSGVSTFYIKNGDGLSADLAKQLLLYGALFGSTQTIYYEGDIDLSQMLGVDGLQIIKVRGTPDQFSVSFNTNGGNYIAPVTYDIYLTEDVTIPTPIKTGSVFCGWYKDAEFTVLADSVVKSGVIGNVVLYALWAKPSDFVSGASVIAFSGPSAVVRIDATTVPAGNIIVKYSEYIDIAEGKILFPFLTGTVAVSAGNDTVAFTNDDGKAIESCSVTFRYTIGATAFYTPLSYANAPASSAKLDLTVDDGLTVTFNGNPVTNGAVVDFDVYQVSVAGGQTVVINGVVWTNGNRMFYGGQKLVVSSMA